MPSPSETKTGPESALGDGGPAYPGGYMVDEKDRGPVAVYAPGMSLRDWFAGQAMAAYLSHPATFCSDPSGLGELLRALSAASYQAADAMLAERAEAVR